MCECNQKQLTKPSDSGKRLNERATNVIRDLSCLRIWKAHKFPLRDLCLSVESLNWANVDEDRRSKRVSHDVFSARARKRRRLSYERKKYEIICVLIQQRLLQLAKAHCLDQLWFERGRHQTWSSSLFLLRVRVRLCLSHGWKTSVNRVDEIFRVCA